MSFNILLRNCFLLYFLSLCIAKAGAQDTSRVVKISTRFITERDIDRNKNWEAIDTSSNRMEIFQAPFKKYILFQDLGNMGSPSRPLLFNANKPVGFSYTQNPFDVYFIKPEETRYINTRTPYTDLFYTQGSNELIFLKATHSQNILPRWNVGINYQRITSQGFLERQNTSLYNYSFFTSYQNKSRTYTLLANATWNRGVVEESGGIQNDSAFESLTGASKAVNVKLSDAQTRFRNRAIHIKQYWNFGRSDKQVNESDTIYNYQNHSHFSYTFHAEEMQYIFQNNGTSDLTLLPHRYYSPDSVTTDSAYYGKLENKLAFNLFNNKEKQQEDSIRTFLGTSLSHTFITVAQDPYIRNYHNIIADISFEKDALKNNTLSLFAYGAYDLTGFNSGDLKATGMIRYRLKIFDLKANGSFQRNRPDYTFLFFKSNQFIWNNAFDKTNITQIGGGISTRSFRNNAHLNINQYAIQNWTYAASDGTPAQETGTIFITTATLSKTFQAWKFFFEHDLIAQTTNNNTVIRLPEFGGMARYYYAARLFKVLRFQLGVTVYYNTSYYGNAYNPATRFFYLQNDVKTGNYPVIDPFFTGDISRASFFAKYEHVNQDWMNKGFYYTPHYPLSLSSFRFGVRWRFYD